MFGCITEALISTPFFVFPPFVRPLECTTSGGVRLCTGTGKIDCNGHKFTQKYDVYPKGDNYITKSSTHFVRMLEK